MWVCTHARSLALCLQKRMHASSTHNMQAHSGSHRRMADACGRTYTGARRHMECIQARVVHAGTCGCAQTHMAVHSTRPHVDTRRCMQAVCNWASTRTYMHTDACIRMHARKCTEGFLARAVGRTLHSTFRHACTRVRSAAQHWAACAAAHSTAHRRRAHCAERRCAGRGTAQHSMLAHRRCAPVTSGGW